MNKYTTLILLSLLTYNSYALIKPAKIFSDNMVLQRGMEIPVWGTANPGEEISIRLITSEVKTIAQSNGCWMVKIPMTNPSGPYALIISGSSERIEFKNVLIGDVWFASGQSNMEHPMKGWEWIPHSAVSNFEQEIADSNFPEIRLFSVPKYPSPVELNNLTGGKWEVTSPVNVSKFSAIGWFFAKELHKNIKVPIGIINSSWGGVPIQTLMSREFLESSKTSVNIQAKPEKFNQEEWSGKITESLENTLLRRNQISYPKTGLPERINNPNYNDSAWKLVDFTNRNRLFENVVWCRKKIFIPESFHGQKLNFSLGFLDRQSQVFLNGIELCFFLYPHPVEIEIPPTLVRSGENILSNRLGQPFGNSKVFGNKNLFFIVNSNHSFLCNLEDDWRANDQLESVIPVVENYQNNPTCLFNGMVASIIPCGIKGFIWYEGESNAGEPYLYEKLFQQLILDWRKSWEQDDLPFLFSQSSNIELSHQFEKKSDSWCMLRESQQKALKLPNTGMAVSLDMGDPYDVHPKNKKDFAHRLVLQALWVAYHQNVISDGLVCNSINANGDTIIIRMNDSASQLRTISPEDIFGFEVAGVGNIFYNANAKLIKKDIYVSSKNVKKPVVVRYAWTNNPQCSL